MTTSNYEGSLEHITELCAAIAAQGADYRAAVQTATMYAIAHARMAGVYNLEPLSAIARALAEHDRRRYRAFLTEHAPVYWNEVEGNLSASAFRFRRKRDDAMWNVVNVDGVAALWYVIPPKAQTEPKPVDWEGIAKKTAAVYELMAKTLSGKREADFDTADADVAKCMTALNDAYKVAASKALGAGLAKAGIA